MTARDSSPSAQAAEPGAPAEGRPAVAERPPGRPKAGWLSRLRPGLKKQAAPRVQETPDNLWLKDPETGEMLYRPDLEAALWVTPSGHHLRLTPEQRFAMIFDNGAYERIKTPFTRDDPLEFRDQKPYVERLNSARASTGEIDAMSIAHGRIRNRAAIVLVQNFGFLGGSLGQAAGQGFIAAAREAIRRDCPLVVFTASGGARMQEGTLSCSGAKGPGAALSGGAYGSDHGRGNRLLRHAGRSSPRRTRRPDRLHRPTGDRADHSRNPSGWLPAR